MAIEQTPELERALQEAADRRASDVHLVPGEPPSFRVAGLIERADAEPLTAEQVEHLAVAAVGRAALDRIRLETGSVQASCGLPGVVDGRLAVASSLGEFVVTIRILPHTIPDVAACRIPAALMKAAEAPRGLILVAGPTGSGKSTAALSLLDHINATRPVHICTVEDPVVVRLTPKRATVQQHEVGTDVPHTTAGLRAALVQDVDVLYVSELKELREVEAVVTLADAGHLVIAVGHAVSPEDMIERLLDIQPPETRGAFAKRLAPVLLAVSVQCLLPKASGKGRVAAYGVLTPDEETRQAMVEGGDIRKRSSPLPDGCRTLADDIGRLHAEGIVTAEAAERALGGL